MWSLSAWESIYSMDYAFLAASTNESVSAVNVDLTTLLILLDAHVNGLLFPTLSTRNTVKPH